MNKKISLRQIFNKASSVTATCLIASTAFAIGTACGFSSYEYQQNNAESVSTATNNRTARLGIAPDITLSDNAPAPKGVFFWNDAYFAKITPAEDGRISAYARKSFMYVVEPHEAMLMKNPKDAAAFQKFVDRFDGLENASIYQKVWSVNHAVNKLVTYTPDEDQDGKEDYWDSAIETLSSDEGDCEDYAILKYYTLLAMGIPDNRMYITLVNAEGKNHSGIDHAVLLVNIAKEGQREHFVLLENGRDVEQISDVDYSFYAAVNEEGVWECDTTFKVMPPAPAPTVVYNGRVVMQNGTIIVDGGRVVVEGNGAVVVNGVIVSDKKIKGSGPSRYKMAW